jgi:hypothetical protein
VGKPAAEFQRLTDQYQKKALGEFVQSAGVAGLAGSQQAFYVA